MDLHLTVIKDIKAPSVMGRPLKTDALPPLSEEALQIAVKRGEAKKQRRKGKIYPFECRVPKNSKERSESLPK